MSPSYAQWTLVLNIAAVIDEELLFLSLIIGSSGVIYRISDHVSNDRLSFSVLLICICQHQISSADIFGDTGHERGVVGLCQFTTMSTADQVTQQERQAYIILSELFLDIEHTPLELQRLSTSLRLLGIPAATLHQL